MVETKANKRNKMRKYQQRRRTIKKTRYFSVETSGDIMDKITEIKKMLAVGGTKLTNSELLEYWVNNSFKEI